MYANEAAVVGGVAEVATEGPVAPRESARVRRMIAETLRGRGLCSAATVRLTGRPAEPGTLVAQVNLLANGTPVRTQIDGPGGFALAFAAERLGGQLDRVLSGTPPRWAPGLGRAPLTAVTPIRPIVRRKLCVPRTCDPIAAVAAMDALDFDAHLFTDADTGETAIVYWAGPLGVRMARQHHVHPPRPLAHLPMTMNPRPALELTESAAATRLCTYGLPFLFYTDPADPYGRLLYRRYDGNLGLVTPIARERN
ncbi:sigma 54 modulation/S30EA ribosomal C-terminal domain-containing protein [Nocardia seriolae]|uniref:Sigma 54 modulation/S30EA ribosomal protein C-terminal domain-containing protein n=1 Tax=Nocardia seriolae TaxID=37332 RepID=A0ABC8AWQ2_9NOCA|nr:sigma 54 modulation/S30EA ribosomal C-terminal domain-containing protein [Nocardia seriolae]APA98404.1 uncharacterized protein NS506_04356 [Nocardia seriolae]OJF80298.1 hypothetical protein NS14008_15170 [Nocardia seriolae]QOW35754.1 sigma 54 modulation/S30EA ribosomal C-terminal domain-containing protein [Nocardia seriolae]QUN16755.1 sigma 54 modulation/S30EA ribosomal C-terminal domain-containing protein [Nocardia seriolae]WNJ56153.1 sigma 54 modulation/S30EA ribosomal C-terminal domain-c